MKEWGFKLFILVLSTFIGFWNLLLLTPLQPFIAADLQISIGKAAQLTTVSAGVALIALILFGRFGHLIDRRFVLWVGLASLSVGSILLTTTENYTLLMFIRIFNGIADGLIYPVAWVLVSEYLPKEKRALGVGSIVAGTGLVAVIGLPITSSLVSNGNWEKSVEIFFYLSVLIFVVSLLLPRSEQEIEEKSFGGFSVILKNVHLRNVATANIFGDVAWFGALIFLGSFLVKSYNPSLFQLSTFFFVSGLAFVAGSLIPQASLQIQKKFAMASSLIVIPLAISFFSYERSLTLTVILAAVYAFSRAPGIVAMDTMLLQAAENSTTRVTAGALTNIITSIGTFAGAALGGFVLDSTTYTALGIVFALCSMISVFFLNSIKIIEEIEIFQGEVKTQELS